MLACCNIPERGLTELDRLAYVVTQIDSDCFIVPRGSVKKIPLNEVRKNEAFRGLNPDQVFCVENYVHFREPLNKDKIDLNQRNTGTYNDDFLDNAKDDIPCGVWSIVKDTSCTLALLRSKLWPGYYSFHKQNTNIYGNFYVGNGCKALDLPF